MDRIGDYAGAFLNHLEGMYRPEDRALAIGLAEAIGLRVVEMKFTASSRPLLAGHFNDADRDPTNNILFLYEMPPMLLRVVDLLRDRVEHDAGLKEAMAAYRGAVAKAPPLAPHFGIRFGSEAALAAVLDRLAHGLGPELAARVSVWEVPPYEPIDGLPAVRQVFVRTDVMTVGTAGFEQAIELQALFGS
ncbi:MAG: hypothetical protein LBV50_04415 [Novosphingobium sp.]|jgi:hypothetical protein|nr:hypothetical protein [Novosphingobium sp.]